MLRAILVLLALGFIGAGIAVWVEGGDARSGGISFFIIGALLLVGTVFEARRYRPKPRAMAEWETTGERFVDPTSGKLTEVRYNPQTGEREYVDVP